MRRLVTVAALVVLAAGAGTARAAVLTCGSVITSPGIYQLTSDLNCSSLTSSGIGLQVLTDAAVTISFNGHTINGPGASTLTVGIDAEAPDVTLLNGVIRGFGTGVHAAENRVTTDNMRVAKNGEGLFGDLDVFFTIRHSYINENSDIGIRDTMMPIYISDSQVLRNGGNGIDAHESAVIADRNVISGNGGYGILNDEWGVVLTGNQVNYNARDGISIGGNPFPDSYTIVNNTMIGNGGHGIDYEPQQGFAEHPLQSEGNIARDNRTNPQCVNIFCRTS